MTPPSPISHLPAVLTTGAKIIAAFRTGGLASVAGLLSGILGAHIFPPMPERVILPPPVVVEEGYRLQNGETATTRETMEALVRGHHARGRAQGMIDVLDALATLPGGPALERILQATFAEDLRP